MKLSNSKIIVLSFLVEGVIGAYLAYLFSSVNESRQFSSLINLFGIFLNFIGVILLSDHFLKIPKKYSHVHELVLSMILGLPFMISIGAVAYSSIAVIIGWKVSLIWANAVGVLTLYVGLALYGFDSMADALQFKFMKDSTIRATYYGWFLLLAGLLMQIYVSVVNLKIA